MTLITIMWSARTELQITSSKSCSNSFLFSDEINSRHPVILGLRNILKMACSNDITTLTLPVLLMHEMTEVNHNTCVIDCGSCIWCRIELLYIIHVRNSHTVCSRSKYLFVLWQKMFLTNSVTVGIFLMYVCRVKCECWMCDILQSLQADVSIMC